MKIDAINDLTDIEARALLTEIFTSYATPAFGALPQRETDLILFAAMRRAGAIAPDASLYDLMTALRITRTKARNLLFDLEIRGELSGESLDAQVRDAIARPRGFVLDGSYIALGIENPVIQAHMRERVRALGHLTDASFDSALVKLKPAALATLVEALMTRAELENFRAGMIAAGLKKSQTIRAALKDGLTHIAKKAIGPSATEVGGALITELADFVRPSVERAVGAVARTLRETFS